MVCAGITAAQFILCVDRAGALFLVDHSGIVLASWLSCSSLGSCLHSLQFPLRVWAMPLKRREQHLFHNCILTHLSPPVSCLLSFPFDPSECQYSSLRLKRIFEDIHGNLAIGVCHTRPCIPPCHIILGLGRVSRIADATYIHEIFWVLISYLSEEKYGVVV